MNERKQQQKSADLGFILHEQLIENNKTKNNQV